MQILTIIELRQYTLHPGRRDELIELFEREFIESQEALGMRLVGLFRDLDNADRFVWLRGFASMPSRAQALAAFYGGPTWKRHRNAANATMIDSDNVLLLRPAFDGAGFADAGMAASTFSATICDTKEPTGEAFARRFVEQVRPLACLVTEAAENNFPALPVRRGENSFVWFEHAPPAPFPPLLLQQLKRPATRLRLAPTARSRLRCATPLDEHVNEPRGDAHA